MVQAGFRGVFRGLRKVSRGFQKRVFKGIRCGFRRNSGGPSRFQVASGAFQEVSWVFKGVQEDLRTVQRHVRELVGVPRSQEVSGIRGDLRGV